MRNVITTIRPDYIMIELYKVKYDQKNVAKIITCLHNLTISLLRSLIFHTFCEKSVDLL